MVPPHKRPSHVVSALAFVPIKIPYTVVSSSEDPLDQLCLVMDSVKESYTAYLANPQLPHFTSFAASDKAIRSVPLLRRPGSFLATNIGVIDQLLPMEWFMSNSRERTLQVDELVFGHRIASLMQYVFVLATQSKLD